MAGDKVEFPPLLSDGFYPQSVNDLRELCVAQKLFRQSATRATLMSTLVVIVERLTALGIKGELWVDGSFLTEKIDPDDIDLTLRILSYVYDNGTAEQVAYMDWLCAIYDTYKIDAYLQLEYPIVHKNYAIGKANYDYWKNQWGRSRNGVAKGIAVIELSRNQP